MDTISPLSGDIMRLVAFLLFIIPGTALCQYPVSVSMAQLGRAYLERIDAKSFSESYARSGHLSEVDSKQISAIEDRMDKLLTSEGKVGSRYFDGDRRLKIALHLTNVGAATMWLQVHFHMETSEEDLQQVTMCHSVALVASKDRYWVSFKTDDHPPKFCLNVDDYGDMSLIQTAVDYYFGKRRRMFAEKQAELEAEQAKEDAAKANQTPAQP